MNNTENKIQCEPGVYLGPRGNEFKKFITKLLTEGGISKKYVDFLTSKEIMKAYEMAFTSEIIDPLNNYQPYEFIGDKMANKFIANYAMKRYRQLMCSEGVKVAARLVINYGAKESFAGIAESLGFWDYISATNEQRQRMKKTLLEDSFEAFIGVTQFETDMRKTVGIGDALAMQFLTCQFDKIDMSIKFEDLMDPKTRLKELFDMSGQKNQLGALKYEHEQNGVHVVSKVFYHPKEIKTKIGEGKACLRGDAEKLAAKEAITFLKKKGISKQAPSVYSRLEKNEPVVDSTPEVAKKNVMKVIHDEKNVNSQFFMRGKPAQKTKYSSTPLVYYCHEKLLEEVKACVELGGNPNEVDSLGRTAMDVLVTGNPDLKLIKKFINALAPSKKKYMIHSNFFETYMKPYLSDEGIKALYDKGKFIIIEEFEPAEVPEIQQDES